jgi:hypothetical protein
MTKREIIQTEMTRHIMEARKTILNVSIRLGKTKIALDAIEEDESVLVVYPLAPIKKSWLDDIKKFPPKSSNITYSTIQSLHKLVASGKTFSYVIVDEPQKCKSEKQITALKHFRQSSRKFVGLTGTLNPKTEKMFQQELNWKVGITYSIADAIKDGLVKDYRIYLHFAKLDNLQWDVAYKSFGRVKVGTEKVVYDEYTRTMQYFREKMEQSHGMDFIRNKAGFQKYMGLRTNLLLNSKSLFDYANKLVEHFSDRKALIYTLRTEVADRLSSKTFHSKSKDIDALERFKESSEGHLAVVNAVQAGITIKKLSTVIFHSYDSNTETLYQKLGRSLLYEFEGEVSEIHIVCLQGTNMEDWVDEACTSLEQDKIFLCYGDVIMPKLEYFKKKYADKQLFLYKGKLVYYSHNDQLTGNPQFCFIKSPDKTYGLKRDHLVEV